MSAGSDASILGYGKMFPNSNINPGLANVYNMHNSANFSNTVIPSHGLQGAANNADAARGVVPCMKGGRRTKVGRRTKGGRRTKVCKTLRQKIKNIYRMYSMAGGKKASMRRKKTMKNKIKSRYLKKGGKSFVVGGRTRRAHKCSSSCVHKRKRRGHKRSGGSTVNYGLFISRQATSKSFCFSKPFTYIHLSRETIGLFFDFNQAFIL